MLKKRKPIPKYLYRVRSVAAVLALAALVGGATIVHADTLQQQINSLNAQNSQKQQSVNDLQLQASSYQDAIDKLQQQIGAIEGALAASTAQQAKLQNQITEDKAKIAIQKGYLSEDIRSMYVDGQLSTIEELATSKDLSDYVDKEEYRTAIQNKVDTTIKQIAALQEQLQSKKQEVDQLVATQREQQAKLDSDKQQKDQLLSYNEGQQNTYNAQIKSNSKKISALEAEQARINAASSRTGAGYYGPSGGHGGACDKGMGNGGYPMAWCNSPANSGMPDGNGIEVRQCTSFAYWYFTSVEGNSLSVSGNAKDWAFTANRPVSHTPHKGDIFVNTNGYYGHVGIVVGISGGWVQTISMNDDYGGHYYNNREYPVDSLYYIH